MITKSGLRLSHAIRAFLLKHSINRTLRKVADKAHFNRPHVQSDYQLSGRMPQPKVNYVQ